MLKVLNYTELIYIEYFLLISYYLRTRTDSSSLAAELLNILQGKLRSTSTVFPDFYSQTLKQMWWKMSSVVSILIFLIGYQKKIEFCELQIHPVQETLIKYLSVILYTKWASRRSIWNLNWNLVCFPHYSLWKLTYNRELKL